MELHSFLKSKKKKIKVEMQTWWHMTIIQPTQEVELGGWWFEASLEES
jgi:hypothetical protein